MSHIEDVARLSRHRKAAEEEVNLTPGPYFPIHMNYHVEIGMNDEWLLAVAGQFQEGDTRTLEDGLSWLESLLEVKEIRPGAEDQAKEIHRVIRCMRRMLAAAKVMEGTDDRP